VGRHRRVEGQEEADELLVCPAACLSHRSQVSRATSSSTTHPAPIDLSPLRLYRIYCAVRHTRLWTFGIPRIVRTYVHRYTLPLSSFISAHPMFDCIPCILPLPSLLSNTWTSHLQFVLLMTIFLFISRLRCTIFSLCMTVCWPRCIGYITIARITRAYNRR